MRLITNLSSDKEEFEKKYLYITKTKLKAFHSEKEIKEAGFLHKVLNKKDYLYTEQLEKMNRQENKFLEKLRIKTEELYNNYKRLSPHCI